MNDLLPEPGVYHDVKDEVYFGWPYASKSTLSQMSESAAACKHALDGKWKQTYAMATGHLIESALQRPDEIDEKYLEAPVITPTAAKFVKCQLDNPGKIVVAPGDILKAQDQAQAICRHTSANNYLKIWREHEQTAFVWDDEQSGVRCKCKTDAIGVSSTMPYTVDLKKIRGDKFPVYDAQRGRIRNAGQLLWYMRDYKYDWQANFYLRARRAMDKMVGAEDVEHQFVFVFIDDKPGRYDGKHRVAVVEYTEAELRFCDEHIDDALRTFKICQTHGEWPEAEDQFVYKVGAENEVGY